MPIKPSDVIVNIDKMSNKKYLAVEVIPNYDFVNGIDKLQSSIGFKSVF